MAADLVTAATIIDHLGLTSSAALITEMDALLEAVEALFESTVGRTDKPYKAAGVTTEVFHGNGSRYLWLSYPIASWTSGSIKIGRDTSDPDEELDVTDIDVLSWRANERMLARNDAGVWGVCGEPRNVEVIYTSAADLPKDVARAVLLMAAALYKQKGAEGLTSERIGAYSYQIAAFGGTEEETAAQMAWNNAVSAHMAAMV